MITAPTVEPAAGWQRSSAGPIHVTNAGVAIATLSVTSRSDSAFRWDRDGRQEILGGLGTDSSGRSNSTVTALTESGTAFGHSDLYSATHQRLGQVAVRWDRGSSVPVELASSGGSYDMVWAASDTGFAVGEVSRTGGTAVERGQRAVRWSGDGQLVELPLPVVAGATRYDASARAVNDSGTTIGGFEVSDGTDNGRRSRLLRWDVGAATPIDLGSIPSFQSTGGAAINDAGTVVANVLGNYYGTRPTRWSSDGSTFVTLEGLSSDPFNSFASSTVSGISEQGDAFGYSDKYVGDQDLGQFAVVWPAGSSTPLQLPRLRDYSFPPPLGASARAMNASGFVVGVDFASAAMWSSDGTPTDLTTLLPAGSGWSNLRAADSISDTGWIAGMGNFDPDGSGPIASYIRHYSLLVPQAGTYGLGDANFDTVVGFADLVTLAQNYGQANAGLGVNVGDLDLNGFVNFQDLVTLAQNYGGGTNALPAGAGTAFAADWALAQALVPEPAMLVAAMTLATVASRRRR